MFSLKTSVLWTVERKAIMPIIKMNVGDILEMKKPHPCGDKRFCVLRIGSEIRLKCLTCGRDMTLDRIKVERAIRSVTPNPDNTNS